MEPMLDLLLHLDAALVEVVRARGNWTYLVLFLVVFCETGLVVTPFLPGDSLLFSAGALAAMGSLEIALLVPLLILAAILGDAANYSLGSRVSRRWLGTTKLLRRDHLARAEWFYLRHGGKAVVLARFAPFLRTFVPFVAGMAGMSYARFVTFNVAGAVAWVAICSLGGFFFGNLPVVRENFTAVLLALILISVLPAFASVFRLRTQS